MNAKTFAKVFIKRFGSSVATQAPGIILGGGFTAVGIFWSKEDWHKVNLVVALMISAMLVFNVLQGLAAMREEKRESKKPNYSKAFIGGFLPFFLPPRPAKRIHDSRTPGNAPRSTTRACAW